MGMVRNQQTAIKERYARVESKEAIQKVREADRILWAVKGIIEHKLIVSVITGLLVKFRRLDIVPTHFNYPELYHL